MTQWFSLRNLFRRSTPLDTTLWPPPAPPPMDDVVEGEESRQISPLAAPVHVYSGSAVVRVDNGVLVVEREDEQRFERPIELVSDVHIHGWATITSPCVGQRAQLL